MHRDQGPRGYVVMNPADEEVFGPDTRVACLTWMQRHGTEIGKRAI